MQKTLLLFVVSLLTFGLFITDAEARRMGGGKSLGYQRSPAITREAPRQPPAATPLRTQPQAAPARPAPSSGASRWLGPLAGIAAGGLLAALLFGDAFQGLQILDFLLFALLALGVFFVIRAMRRRAQSPPARTQSMAYAGNSATPATKTFEVPEIGGGLRDRPTVGAGIERGASPRPAWFDEQAFLKAAKTHFIRLQAAWDKKDIKDIQEYTTPELFAELSMQLQERGEQKNFTEVVSLDVELLDLITEGDRVIASVRFSGLIREEESAQAQPFSEVWHIQRSLNEPSANWYVAGIQQASEIA
jgi:predicted lipid-binding transport protein (Tim44 family)